MTEVGKIPEDWATVKFCNITFMKGRIGWQGLKKEEFSTDQSLPFLITGMNFKDGEIRWDEVYHVSEDRYEIAKEIQLRSGDVLMTKDGTIGKILFVNEIPAPYKATLNSHLLVFRPINNAYDPKFLYYNLQSKYFLSHIELSKSGSTFFGISQEAVGKYLIPLPPTLTEQKAIATALSDVDALISSLDKLIEKKKAIKQGAMQELLTGKTRLAGFGNGAGYKMTELGKIPNDWLVQPIAEIAEVIGGGTPSTSIESYWNGTINWFTPTEVGEQKYSSNSDRKISSAGLDNSSAKMLPTGTILLTSRASIGDLSILLSPATTNQGFQSLVAKGNTFNEFIYYSMLLRKSEFLKYASGSTFLEISPAKVRAIKTPVPPTIFEQKAIATALSDMDAEIEELETKRDKYKLIKQGMMQELLTGKTRLI